MLALYQAVDAASPRPNFVAARTIMHATQPPPLSSVRRCCSIAMLASEEVWNSKIKRAWTKAYASALGEYDYQIEEVEGSLPANLRGTLFRNGPGNFERGGRRYEHVLDGDGYVCAFAIDGTKSVAHFSSKFVRTPEFEAEEAADQVLYRNTFGTQPDGGWRTNLGNVQLKNPANTNVQAWGGKLYALWEAALPVRLDRFTLASRGSEDFGGILRSGDGPLGGLTVTTGVATIDRVLGLGQGFTAHPRPDPQRAVMVGWAWAASVDQSDLQVDVFEWGLQYGELQHRTSLTMNAATAPHDFVITDSYYLWVHNAMALRVAPFVLGNAGPVECLRTTGRGVTIQLVSRPDGPSSHGESFELHTDDPYFAIHHACAFEECEGGSTELHRVLRLYTAAWPKVGEGPFLGDWGGAVPLFSDGRIPATQLFETIIELPRDGPPRLQGKRVLVDGACIDHPHIDPRFEGDARCRYIYMSYCNAEGNSGSPPIGWARWDRLTGETVVWRAPAGSFCEEVVIIPKAEETRATQDTADVWLAGMLFDSERGVSCLAILDGSDMTSGPVCRLWLTHAVPHGLHGCFVKESQGAGCIPVN